MSHRILDSIDSPDKLKLLTDEELSILANEIRAEIIDVTSKTGGHVASSLGAVETILAVHSLIDSPHDRFLFDVGHQSYAHMIITGRLGRFPTLRQYKGLSGFPKPHSNPHDVHPSGHASDSLSVACGLARARDLVGGDQKIVALIGDASIAGGMAFEALNDIGQAQTPLVIILNDNEMSISRNVGAVAKHLGSMRVRSDYRYHRDTMQEFMESSLGPAGKAMVKLGRNAKESVKQFVVPDTMLFEQFGIVCTPPVDGHDIPALKFTIKRALEAEAPVLVHVVTKKGAGFKPAEEDPSRFHGIGPYDPITGETIKKPSSALTYTQAFTRAFEREAQADESLCAISAAMVDGTGLRSFADNHPDRCFDVGIAEGHAVGMASGLALGGRKPLVALYSTFLQRAIDQVIIDIALEKLDVVFAIDRAGLVGDDGPTHHGMFDMALLRCIPNMRILAPSNEAELAHALHTALRIEGPVALRYPRGEAAGVPFPDDFLMMRPGCSRLVREGEDAAILAFGRMVSYALAAAEQLEREGISVRVVDMRWVKPLDVQAIAEAAKTKAVVTVEDGVATGGAGEGVAEVLALQGSQVPLAVLGLPDDFVAQGKVDQLFSDIGVDAEGIAATLKSLLAG